MDNKTYLKEYYKKNKEVLLEKQKERNKLHTICEFCDTIVRQVQINSHKKTFLHKKNLIKSLNLDKDELIKIIKLLL